MQLAKLATIEDVAAIAGVSIATVSRAINEPAKVAEATRRRVNEAVAVTGYTTNAMARSLRMRRSNMIMILAPDVGDPNFSTSWSASKPRPVSAVTACSSATPRTTPPARPTICASSAQTRRPV